MHRFASAANRDKTFESAGEFASDWTDEWFVPPTLKLLLIFCMTLGVLYLAFLTIIAAAVLCAVFGLFLALGGVRRIAVSIAFPPELAESWS